jgi:transcriptional regulator with XRE-family HTH domain
MTALAKKVRFLRKDVHKLTQKQLAEKAGIGVDTLSNIERLDHLKSDPLAKTLAGIAKALKVSVEYLLDESEIMFSIDTINNGGKNVEQLKTLMTVFAMRVHDENVKIKQKLDDIQKWFAEVENELINDIELVKDRVWDLKKRIIELEAVVIKIAGIVQP